MARFVHHYTRWEAHSESAQLETQMADTVVSRLAPVVQAAMDLDGSPSFNFGGQGLSFVHAAFTELLECRSVLQHSYAFSYFRYPSLYSGLMVSGRRREKVTFERLQSELEMLTEQMSDIVARRHLRATQVQITFLTANAAEKRQDLSNLLFSILHDEEKESKKAKRWELFDGVDEELNTLMGRAAARVAVEEMVLPAVQMWECSACTYMNQGGRRCAMCGTRHRESS